MAYVYMHCVCVYASFMHLAPGLIAVENGRVCQISVSESYRNALLQPNFGIQKVGKNGLDSVSNLSSHSVFKRN